MNDMEMMMQSVMNSPNAAKIMKNFDKISGVLNSEEGKLLFKSLSTKDPQALRKLVANIAAGDTDSAKNLMKEFSAGPGGDELINKINDILK